MRFREKLALAILIAVLISSSSSSAPPLRPQRVPPSTLKGTSDIFFDDVFKEGLVGSRPTFDSSSRPVGPTGTLPAGNPGGTGTSSGKGWSKIISVDTLQDEVKATRLRLTQDVKSLSDFKSRGFSLAEQHFSMLAMLLAVDAEYDGDVRWKKSAPAARDLFARVAGQCKAGTDQAYKAAKERMFTLEDMLNGQTIDGADSAQQQADWGKVAERAPLMKWMKEAVEKRLQPMTANPAEFKANQDRILHDAELLAAIAHAMTRPGMDDADDDDYVGISTDMKKLALEIAGAVRDGKQEVAASALSRMNTSCEDCHDDYK